MAPTLTTRLRRGQPSCASACFGQAGRVCVRHDRSAFLPMTVAAAAGGCASRAGRSACCLAVLGVVYGDIGTSPLYAFKASLQHFPPKDVTNLEIMGILSLIFWSLVLVVTVKYVMLIMRADNRGEGGILALMALAQRVSVGVARAQRPDPDRHRRRLPVLRRRRHHAGDLGAVGGRRPGGLGARTAAIRPADQRCRDPPAVRRPVARHRQCRPRVRPGHGGLVPVDRPARRAGRSCGTRSCCWRCRRPMRRCSACITGCWPSSCWARSVLCVTGAEALYADMGHFGARGDPPRLAVLRAALPGAELFRPGRAADRRAERRGQPVLPARPALGQRLPMVVLATAATVIASQAMISGAFSMARQCMQLGFLPRMTVRHTEHHGGGPDLRAAGQRHAGDRRDHPGAGVQDLGQPGRGLRHRGHRHVPVHQRAGDGGVPPPVPLVAAHRDRGVRLVLRDRFRVLLRQPAEGARGRLGPAGAGQPR